VPTLSRSLLAALYVAAALSATARAAEPVTNTLTVQRVALRADGAESLEAAAAAKPGDLLEYRAEFRNTGSSAARGLQATLPIPPGVTFVAGSARPAGALASTDGTNYAPLPLTRRVRHADGTETTERVPLGDYRYLRFAPTDLAANGALSVHARVVVDGRPPPAATAH
jgi:uncharacterized repeat protein (TIGR01451 family)